MKVIHVLYQSLPHLSGTSIRSRDIIKSQREIGIEAIAVTSPFQKPFNENSNGLECLDGIKYYRTYNNKGLEVTEGISSLSTKIQKLSYIFSFTFKLLKILRKENPDVIHAHATFFTAFSAKFCAVICRKPFIYEVRSLWDERQKQLAKSKLQHTQLSVVTKLENAAIKSADHVIVINGHLKENLVSRGIKNEISIVKNAVNLSLIPDSAKQKASIYLDKREIVFGYIGSLTVIEGLPFLIDEFAKLQDQKVKLLIFGTGPIQEELSRQIKNGNISNVEICGKFYPDKVASIYNQVDCIINPRVKNKLSDTVTPLKPLEALGYKKLFIGSDVGGIKQLIKDRETGLLFKAEDSRSFQNVIKYVLDQNSIDEIKGIIENGYKDVKENYSWKANAYVYRKIYDQLLSDKYKVEVRKEGLVEA
jgi:glycogen(starch) synthase